jgi:transcriptional regulator with XRE-family HTH domain
MDFGSRIRAARRAAGLSQEELARRADMSLKGMGDIERGVIPDPHYSSLSKIANGLGIAIGELLEEPSSPKAPAPTSSANPPSSSAATEAGQQSVESQICEALSSYMKERARMYEKELEHLNRPHFADRTTTRRRLWDVLREVFMLAKLFREQAEPLARSLISEGQYQEAMDLIERHMNQGMEAFAQVLIKAGERTDEPLGDLHSSPDEVVLKGRLDHDELRQMWGLDLSEFDLTELQQGFVTSRPQQLAAKTRQATQDFLDALRGEMNRT